MNKYIIQFITVASLLSPCAASDAVVLVGPQTRSFTSCLANFTKERISGLYYTTSVAGYDSYDYNMHEYLKSKLVDGWNLGEFSSTQKNIPAQGEAGFKPYDDIVKKGFKVYENYLDLNPGQTVEDLEVLEHKTTYQYLYKETQGNVSIILLDKASSIDCALKGRKTEYSYEQLMDGNVTNQLSDSIHGIAIKIIDIRYSDLDDDTKASQIKELNAQKEILEAKRSGIFSDLKKHMSLKMFSSWFEISENRLESFYDETGLLGLSERFQNTHLDIHFLLRSEAGVSENLCNRVAGLLSGGNISVIGHYCGVTMNINPDNQSLKVKVVDPTFNVERPYVKALFGLKEPLEQKCLRLFTKFSESLNLRLNHGYYFRGDQVVNMSDCGRFSMIYLLSEINGKEASSLTNYDIYQGLQTLEEDGYELIHQTKTDINQVPQVQSWFSKYITGPLIRTPCNFILKRFFS